MFGEVGLEAAVLRNSFPCTLSICGCQILPWTMPSVPGQWQPGPWGLHFQGEVSATCLQGPGSLALRLGVSSNGSALGDLPRSAPPELPLWDHETHETGVSLDDLLKGWCL